MKKVCSLILVIAFILSLTGCGSSNRPETVVTKMCDALKAFDAETVSSCFESANTDIKEVFLPENDEQNIFSAQIKDYLKSCANEMTYTVEEYTVDGEIAVVPVTFTYLDASPVISAAFGEYISQAVALAFRGADDSILEELFSTIFIEKTKTTNTGTATAVINFKCIKTSEGWKIQSLDDDTLYDIKNIISCNIPKTMDSIKENNGIKDSLDFEPVEDYIWTDVSAGQVIELATIKIAIIGCEEVTQLTAQYREADVAQEGTKFIILTAEIENITKKTLDGNVDLLLTDSQEREYRRYSDAAWYFDEVFTYSTSLNPNIKTVGTFVYHVPADSEGYYLTIYKDGTNEAYRLFAQ